MTITGKQIRQSAARSDMPAGTYVTKNTAIKLLMEKGDYSRKQALIILIHARSWADGNRILYSLDYLRGRCLNIKGANSESEIN